MIITLRNQDYTRTYDLTFSFQTALMIGLLYCFVTILTNKQMSFEKQQILSFTQLFAEGNKVASTSKFLTPSQKDVITQSASVVLLNLVNSSADDVIRVKAYDNYSQCLHNVTQNHDVTFTCYPDYYRALFNMPLSKENKLNG